MSCVALAVWVVISSSSKSFQNGAYPCYLWSIFRYYHLIFLLWIWTNYLLDQETRSDFRTKNIERDSVTLWFSNLIQNARCLKTKEKVAFNNASEASYIYSWSGQKLKNAKNSLLWRVLKTLKNAVKQCYQTGQS